LERVQVVNNDLEKVLDVLDRPGPRARFVADGSGRSGSR
jgi:hypothetical protein